MKLKNKFAVNNDCKIAYYISENCHTENIPLLVINGGPGQDSRYLLYNSPWQEISKNQQVIFYDQRGTGLSEIINKQSEYGLETQLLDICSILESNNISKVNILAHSWGGFLGLAFVSRYSEKVERLILVNAAGSKLDITGTGHNEFFPDKIETFSKYLESEDEKIIYDKAVEHNMYLNFLNKEHVKPFLTFVGKEPLNAEINEKVFSACKEIDLSDELQKIQAKVLIIHGRYDITVKPIVAYNLQKNIKKSEIIFFESSAHMPFIEEKEKFVNVINSFLNY